MLCAPDPVVGPYLDPGLALNPSPEDPVVPEPALVTSATSTGRTDVTGGLALTRSATCKTAGSGHGLLLIGRGICCQRLAVNGLLYLIIIYR